MTSDICSLPLPGDTASWATDRLPGLDQWVQEQTTMSAAAPASPVLRFAFYGRVSAEDHQDPATSRGWQLLRAQALTSGYGHITAEYFDIGRSRSTPWPRRPEAAALLATLADPDRAFDAIVIGSGERAFHGNQFTVLAPLFDHYKIPVWVPELGGAADPQTAGHEELMVLLGIRAKREVARARMRALTSMTIQARDQGRYLGGRPPYGYRLADAGPHPNRGLARRGVRAHRLVPDPTTAPIVTWIFPQRLAGHTMARIARALNDAHIPCPSAADPERNPHRRRTTWNATVVRAILANPRYTGRQVWNRQRTDHVLLDPTNTTLGNRDVRRWHTPENWSISTTPAHRALVSETDFVAVQHIRTPRETAPDAHTSSPACSAAHSAGARWTPAGPTNTPPTAAATATLPPPPPAATGPAMPTYAKTASCPTRPPSRSDSAWPQTSQPRRHQYRAPPPSSPASGQQRSHWPTTRKE